MTLGELKADLKQYGIRAVGTLRDHSQPDVVIYFSSDRNIVFPHRPKDMYPLVLSSTSDDEHVNDEKVKALKRALVPDWRE